MRRSALMLAALAAMMWMAGCADKDPVSSQNEGADSPAGKLVISKTKAGGLCELPPCKGSAYWGVVLTAILPGEATMDFVRITPGTFVMGGADYSPQHQVTISKGFYLGKFEITQGQWTAVMGTAPWSERDHVQENPNNPAVYISWDDMQVFVGKLNQAAGASLYRLPTEAEWEYACRAGTTTAWSFGDDERKLKDYAWYADNAWNVGEQYGHAVGTKKPNPWGLFDMHGNVWEWVQDRQGAYSSSSQTDPTGPSSGSNRIYRGGWSSDPSTNTRSMTRSDGQPDMLSYAIGARLVRIK